MRRLLLILVILSIVDLQLVAQRVDTLYSGLRNASSFIVLNNAIYVVESGNHRILKLNLNGKLIDKYGKRGGGNYQFDSPKSIASSVGLKIFVSDPGNDRIQVFDKRWQYLSTIKGNEKFQNRDEISPLYLGVNSLRQTIFYDTKTRSFGKYDEDGTFLDNIPVSSDIKSVDGVQISGDKIFILDKKSEIIHRLSDNGFYESFYPAKNVTNFQFIDGKMLLVQNMIFMMNQINADDSRIIYLENPSQKVFKNEGFVYLLTSEELFRIPLR